MGIKVESNSIYIDNIVVTFEDIYKSVLDSEGYFEQNAKKIGDNSYFFDYDFYIGKKTAAAIKDKNVQVIINGEHLQVYEGSYFQLGEKDAKGSPNSGCTLSMPNVKNAYGFGCKDKEDKYTLSGNLFLYASTLNVYGFWGFFNKPKVQKVEVMDCIINGYGRFSGYESVLKGIIFLRSTHKYGTLSTIESIKEIKNIKLNETLSDNASALYFNPKISKNCLIKNFESYHHNTLVFCEKAEHIHTLTLLDPKIPEDNTYRFKDSMSIIKINYSVKFISKNPKIRIKIHDSNNNELYSFSVDKQPLISLNYLTIKKDSKLISQPYNVIIDDTFIVKILPKDTLTLDIDLLYAKRIKRNELEFFITSENKFELGSLIQVFVKSYTKPNIAMFKFNGRKISEPINIVKVDRDFLYRIDFLLGDIGDIGFNEEKWVNGQYYLKGFDLNKDFPYYKNIKLTESGSLNTENEAVIRM